MYILFFESGVHTKQRDRALCVFAGVDSNFVRFYSVLTRSKKQA